MLDNATHLDSGLDITDSQSGFRAFATYTKDVFRFEQNGLAFESEMLADAANAGLQIKEVGIGVRYDVGSSSENPLSHGVKVLVKIFQDMELNRPLYYFSAPGIVMSTIGIGMGLNFMRVVDSVYQNLEIARRKVTCRRIWALSQRVLPGHLPLAGECGQQGSSGGDNIGNGAGQSGVLVAHCISGSSQDEEMAREFGFEFDGIRPLSR